MNSLVNMRVHALTTSRLREYRPHLSAFSVFLIEPASSFKSTRTSVSTFYCTNTYHLVTFSYLIDFYPCTHTCMSSLLLSRSRPATCAS